MNTITLVKQGGSEAVAYACGGCGVVFSLTNPDDAERCCRPTLCACGAETRRHWLACDDCRQKADETKEVARRAAATVVEWGDFMVCDARNDRWYTDADEIGDTDYGYASIPFGLHIDADDIVESALEDHHEDAGVADDLMAELRTFLAGWCDRANVVSYDPDYSRVVLLEAGEVQS